MGDINVPGLSTEAFESALPGFAEIVNSYHADPAFRSRVQDDPIGTFREYGINLPSTIAVQVHANDDDTFYVIFPPDPNVELADEALEAIAGGDTVGSAGSVATAS